MAAMGSGADCIGGRGGCGGSLLRPCRQCEIRVIGVIRGLGVGFPLTLLADARDPRRIIGMLAKRSSISPSCCIL